VPKLMRMPSVIHTPLVQFSPLLSGQPVFPLLRCFIIALGQRWRWGVCLVATALNRPAVRIFGVPLTDRLFSFSLPRQFRPPNLRGCQRGIAFAALFVPSPLLCFLG
jgi:hypothetical protein